VLLLSPLACCLTASRIRNQGAAGRERQTDVAAPDPCGSATLSLPPTQLVQPTRSWLFSSLGGLRAPLCLLLSVLTWVVCHRCFRPGDVACGDPQSATPPAYQQHTTEGTREPCSNKCQAKSSAAAPA
jgi:hypothetical protein